MGIFVYILSSRTLMRTDTSIEFEITGEAALFSDPVTRVGGEKFSYQIPTYESLKGILHSIYWKPTLIWVIDEVRIMNPIQTECKGMRIPKYNDGSKNDLSFYTYLTNVRYQVKAHFLWNENRPELEKDRNVAKHIQIFKRSLEKGGRRDIFLGARECQGYVNPCRFGEGQSYYDGKNIHFGNMYHGITYPDEAFSEETKGKMTLSFFDAIMKDGIIKFPSPWECTHKVIKEMQMKKFGEECKNFHFEEGE